MDAILVLALTTVTSVGAYWLGRWNGWPRRAFVLAVARVAECAGVALGFLIANLGLGLATVLVLRSLPLPFVSIYTLDDVSFVIISAIQGMIVHSWWTAMRH